MTGGRNLGRTIWSGRVGAVDALMGAVTVWSGDFLFFGHGCTCEVFIG